MPPTVSIEWTCTAQFTPSARTTLFALAAVSSGHVSRILQRCTPVVLMSRASMASMRCEPGPQPKLSAIAR
eukprot:scaffold98814_cov73-Phaeocystis_antarctica.AAC.7